MERYDFFYECCRSLALIFHPITFLCVCRFGNGLSRQIEVRSVPIHGPVYIIIKSSTPGVHCLLFQDAIFRQILCDNRPGL